MVFPCFLREDIYDHTSDIEKEERELEDLIRRCTANITRLEKCNEEWLKLLDSLKGKERKTEDKEYCWAAEGDDGFIKLLLDSSETVSQLQGRLSQVLRKQERSTPTKPECSRTSVEMEPKVKPQVKLPKLNLPNFDGNILHCLQISLGKGR